MAFVFLSRVNLHSNGKDVENTTKNRDTGHNQVNNAAAARRGAKVSEVRSIAPRIMRIDQRHTRYRTVPWLRIDDGNVRIRAREGGRAGGCFEGGGSVAMRGF